MTNETPQQQEPSEMTGLLAAQEEQQEEPPVTVTSNVLGGTYIQENEPVGPCCYNCFKYFHMITALVPAFMMVAQIVAWIIFATSTDYMEMILRSYVIVFCILFIQAELRIGAQSGIITTSPLNNWMYRGFIYTFVGIIGTEMSLAALGHFYPELPGFEGMIVSIILKSSSYAMIGLGVLYIVMSVLCLQKVFQGAEQAHQERLVEQLAETNEQQEENAV